MLSCFGLHSTSRHGQPSLLTMPVMQAAYQGDVQLLLRHRLECTVLRSWGTKDKNGCTPETHLVLNDVTIHRGMQSSHLNRWSPSSDLQQLHSQSSCSGEIRLGTLAKVADARGRI